MDSFAKAAVMIVAGWTSGFSVYLTVAILGIAGRQGWIDLPGSLSVLEHPLVLSVALFLYAIEFVADKVPFLDSMWDAAHTPVRPLGAAALGWLASTEQGPAAQAVLALLTGAVALNAHSLKASTRLAINASPEPFTNILASLAGDASVVLLFWIAAKHPFLACAAVAVFLVGSFFVLRALWRFVRALFRRAGPAAP